MAGVKSHWNQTVADDPLGTARREGPGRITTTSSAGDAAGPMSSAGASKADEALTKAAPLTSEQRSKSAMFGVLGERGGGSGKLMAQAYKKQLDRERYKTTAEYTNKIQGVNRKR